MSKIKLLYFKPSGKWGYEGELEFPDSGGMYHLNELIREMKYLKELPGLMSGSWDGPIYIDSSEHPMGFPQLII